MTGFRVLGGGVVAYDDRGEIPLGPARQQAVLAAFLLEPGALVAIEELVERVWGASPPQRARQTLHTYLSRLRGALGDTEGAALVRRSGSYALEVDASAVDLHQFRALAIRARQATDDDRAAALWQEAMALWHGRPFADLDSDWLRRVAVSLEAERLAAVLDRADVLLRRGEHARLLPELAATAAAHPLDERLAGQLMLALYRCGRQADALAHHRLLRDRLVDELGSDPGPALQELHQRILRQDPQLLPAALAETPSPSEPSGALADPLPGRSGPAPEVATSPLVVPRPAQLPADVAGFTGRATDLRRLDALLDSTQDGAARAVVIAAIAGTAGVGKTALAVHWAHRVADRFPDGQLYVNLRGYDPQQPVPATEALARFLAALGLSDQSIPLEPDERAARYRSELAGRRMLILLDNAASVAQVSALLPGNGSCLVIVTSRDSLAGLVAVHGANRLDLDLLSSHEAVSLLRRLVGPRVAAEPEAAATLAEQCVRLPLALRVAAELAVSRPDISLADLAAELADRQTRLELLDADGDPHAAVRQVFSWSIQQLPPEAARAFRVLGLHPGPDLDTYAAAALAGTSLGQARRMLELLARAHLVQRTGRNRYSMHDLLRGYAAHLSTTNDTPRHAAQTRLLNYYQAAAVSAMDTLHPDDAHDRPAVAVSGIPIPDLTEPEAARAWLEAERSCAVTVAAHASTIGRADFAIGFARILHRYLFDAHLPELLAINGHAHRAAEQAGDVAGQAHALRRLAAAYNRSSQHEAAIDHFQRALTLFRRAGDLPGEALTLSGLGSVNHRLGNYKQAIEDHVRAIELSRRAGDRLREAFGLTNLGAVEERLGRYTEAADRHRQALASFRELGSQFYQAQALINLACVELRQGRYVPAAEHLRQSLALIQHLGSPVTEAHALDGLGTLHLHTRKPERATGYFRQALTLWREAGELAGQAAALNGLGESALLVGELANALVHHTDALAIASRTGSRQEHARAHAGLGHAYRVQADPDQARVHYESAYALYTELAMPEAEDVGAHLAVRARARE